MSTELLAAWSDNFIYSATAVMLLAFFAHAAEWAFTREGRTRQVQTRQVETRQVEEGSAEVPAARESREADVLVGAGVATGGAGSISSTGATYGSSDSAEGPAANGETAVGRSELFGRIGGSLTVLATVLLGFGVLARGLAAGRVPWSNLWEFSTTGTFVIAVVYLLASKRLSLGWLGLPITGFIAAVLGLAIELLYAPVGELIPALQSYWLIIHVSAATTATGVFTVGFLASVLQMLRARAERKAVAAGRPIAGYLGRVPSAEGIDRIAYRLHAFAFPIWTFAMITGAIWAAEAWSRPWAWDPKETWMFITWAVYASYLHARSTAGWRRRAPWVAIIGYGALLFNLIGVNFLVSGLHSYAGV